MLNTVPVLINRNLIFTLGDNVRMRKCKNIFTRGYVLNWNENIFIIKK